MQSSLRIPLCHICVVLMEMSRNRVKAIPSPASAIRRNRASPARLLEIVTLARMPFMSVLSRSLFMLLESRVERSEPPWNTLFSTNSSRRHPGQYPLLPCVMELVRVMRSQFPNILYAAYIPFKMYSWNFVSLNISSQSLGNCTSDTQRSSCIFHSHP